MPRWRPRKVDCAGVSAASDVAVVMTLLFGHVDGEKRVVGAPGVGGVSTKSTPRSCSGSLTRWRWVVRSTGCGEKVFPGESLALWRQRRRCLRVSLPSWGRRCGYPPCIRAPGENLGLWSRHWRRKASLPSLGHCRGAPVTFGFGSLPLVASLVFLYFWFIFDLSVRGSPHHLVSVRPLGFIYKAGRKPISSICGAR
jgi:hypothetical protein